jgi:hypothetical protein
MSATGDRVDPSLHFLERPPISQASPMEAAAAHAAHGYRLFGACLLPHARTSPPAVCTLHSR